MPKLGKIIDLKKSYEIKRFSHQQLSHNDLLYLSNSTSPELDQFSIRACFGTSNSRCTNSARIFVELKAVNLNGPEITKNEPLHVWNANSVLLSDRYLKAQDVDTPASQLKYLVWQPIGGFVTLNSDVGTAINTFTQADIDNRRVLFVFSSSNANSKCKI